jgi:hypothetical protein
MTLSKGNIIKLIDADRAAVVLSDWLNTREPTPGDIALVEEISIAEGGCIVRLLCEKRAGFLDWRTSFFEAGLTYEMLFNCSNDIPS